MNHHTTYAVDLAKSVFEIAVSNHPGHVRERHRLSRERFLNFFAQQKPGTVLLEACGSAHHWARSMKDLGHHVVLLPPHRVRPYVTGNKTDRADATALLEAADEIVQFERRLGDLETQLKALTRSMPDVQLLLTIPGIGPITATALVAFVGDACRFPSGRHFASYLGLTPKEHSSGLTRRLGSISRRGDTYLRMLLVHGARSILWSARRKSDPHPIQIWALEIERLRGHNKAAVALANKLSRITWAVWRDQRTYERRNTSSN